MILTFLEPGGNKSRIPVESKLKMDGVKIRYILITCFFFDTICLCKFSIHTNYDGWGILGDEFLLTQYHTGIHGS